MDDAEHRLVAAAEALRQHDGLRERSVLLAGQDAELTEQLSAARSQLEREQAGVRRLDRPGVTRLLAALRGGAQARLTALAARATRTAEQVAALTERRAAVRLEAAHVAARLTALAKAPDAYRAAGADWAQQLLADGDLRGLRLQQIGLQRDDGLAELDHLRAASALAERALTELLQARIRLSRASGWSTVDTFLGGGIATSLVKHSRIDDAARATARADAALDRLRDTLAAPATAGSTAPDLHLDPMTRIIDTWFDNPFTDLAVGDRLRVARRDVDDAERAVRATLVDLDTRRTALDREITALDAERAALLASAGRPAPAEPPGPGGAPPSRLGGRALD
jgi:hypothetical protein